MKKLQKISFPVAVLSLICMMIHFYILSFPDWAVRLIGVLLLLSMFAMVFSTIRLSMTK